MSQDPLEAGVQPLPLDRLLQTYFSSEYALSESFDVYCHVNVSVDTKKHVKPLEVRQTVAKP